MTHPFLSSVLSGALAIYEPALNEFLGQFRADVKAERGTRAKREAAVQSGASDGPDEINNLIQAPGVAVLPIHGVMLQRTRTYVSWWGDTFVLAGSDHWTRILSDLGERQDIEHVVLDFDTGGGQVAGTAQLADAVFRLRQTKNVIACVNEFCASAGLWVATAAGRVVIPATGTIGSLGVYTLHFDDTKFWSELGVEKSVIHRGKYKAVDERNLTADDREQLQAFIDDKYSLFVDAVARNRGLAAAEVIARWGDSAIYSGAEAVRTGLADELGTLQDVLDSLKAGQRGHVLIDLPADDLEDEAVITTNPQGQLIGDKGNVIGSIAELQLTAAQLATHCKPVLDELIAAAVKTAVDAAALTATAEQDAAAAERSKHLSALQAAVGAEKAIAAFVAGQSVEAAKAALADELTAELAETKAKLAEAEKAHRAPPFGGSADKGASGKPAAGGAGDSADPFANDWAKNVENCQNEFRDFPSYAAYRRHCTT